MILPASEGPILPALRGCIEKLTEGNARIRYPLDVIEWGLLGITLAGAVAVFLDNCMSYAAMSAVPGARCSTVSLSMNCFRGVESGDVVAIGRVVSSDQRVMYLEGDLFDSDEGLVAHGTSSLRFLP